MEMYDSYYFWGMHLFWWIFWLIFLILVFGWYQPISRKKLRKDKDARH